MYIKVILISNLAFLGILFLVVMFDSQDGGGYDLPSARLKRIRDQATQYLKNKQISDVGKQMRDELGQSANIKSKQTRKNVQSAIEVIMQRIRLFKVAPENGLVFWHRWPADLQECSKAARDRAASAAGTHPGGNGLSVYGTCAYAGQAQ